MLVHRKYKEYFETWLLVFHLFVQYFEQGADYHIIVAVFEGFLDFGFRLCCGFLIFCAQNKGLCADVCAVVCYHIDGVCVNVFL